MRVLHAPMNMAGQATTLAASLRNLGVASDVIVFNRHPFGYEGERSLDLENKKWIVEKAAMLIWNFIRCLTCYDIFHFHFGRSLLPHEIDLPLLRLSGKKVVMHYWGDDIRQNDIATGYTCLSIEDLRHIYPWRDDDKIRERVNKINKYIKKSIVGDYSLQPYSPKSLVIKQAINLSELGFCGTSNKEKQVKIVHAPSNRGTKGTKHVISAIERLNEEGYEIDFVLLERMSNSKVREHCQQADIIIDQLLLESYGIFAIECMAMGKPVLCRIDEHFVKCYPGLPIINTDPAKIYENLKMLIDNPALRIKLGRKGREFVEDVHDSRKIAEQLKELYRAL